MNIALATDLNNLEKSSYDNTSITTFIEKHTSESLFNFFRATKNEAFKQKIVKLFKSCSDISPEYPLQFIKQLAKLQYEETIKILQNKTYDLNIYQFLRKQQMEIQKIISIDFGICIFLIKIVGEEQGLQLLKLVTKLIKKGQSQFFKTQQFLNILNNGLKNKNSIVKLRYMQLIIEGCLGPLGQSIQKLGLLNEAIKIYDTTDILQKLASVEILQRLGTNSHTAELLRQHEVWLLMQKDAFDQQNPYFVQKSLICLLIRQVIEGHVQFSYSLSKKISNFLLQSIRQGPQQTAGALSIIQYLFEFNQGIQCFLSEKQFVEKFALVPQIGTHQEKRLFFQALTILTDKTVSAKAAGGKHDRLIINVLSVVGHPGIIGGFDMRNGINDYGIPGFIQLLFKQLYLPFQDIQILTVKLLLNIISLKRLRDQLVTEQKKLVDYLINRHAGNNTIYETKKQVIKAICQCSDFEELKKDLQYAEKQKRNALHTATQSA